MFKFLNGYTIYLPLRPILSFVKIVVHRNDYLNTQGSMYCFREFSISFNVAIMCIHMFDMVIYKHIAGMSDLTYASIRL